MERGSIQMKRFSKQLDNTDNVVFTVMEQSFIFSAKTLTYFPLTECAKDLLLTSDWEKLSASDVVKNRYDKNEIEKTCLKLKEFTENGVISPVTTHEKGEIFYNDYYLKLVQSTRCNLNCSYCSSLILSFFCHL